MHVLCDCFNLHFLIITDNNTTPLQLRLVNGGNEREGRLEILYYGIWGTVCDEGFTFNSANVACRRLGYPGALLVKTDFPYIRSNYWLSQVKCIGNETALEECSHNGFGLTDRNCAYYEDVGVVCIGMY